MGSLCLINWQHIGSYEVREAFACLFGVISFFFASFAAVFEGKVFFANIRFFT